VPVRQNPQDRGEHACSNKSVELLALYMRLVALAAFASNHPYHCVIGSP
jgi:hypothetical protein